MTRIILSISLCFALTACDSDDGKQVNIDNTSTHISGVKTVAESDSAAQTKNLPTVDKTSEVAVAKDTVKTFANALKTELMAGMKEGGPVAAINVCNTKAPEITAHISDLKGRQLSRTSLKVRNPKNAPTDWQKAVLEDFDKQLAEGKDPATISYAEIIEENGNKQFRFMKAIPTKDVCLSCHGKKLSSDISKRLKTLYPEDKATGYKKGEIRGAFVVINNL